MAKRTKKANPTTEQPSKPTTPVPQAQAGANVIETPAPVVDDIPKPKLIVKDYMDEPKAAAPSPAPQTTPAAKPEPTPVATPNKSTVANPVKTVWAIAEEMKAANPQTTRKEIVEECIRRGVAFYTARTQYQLWTKSKKGPA